IPAKIKRGLKEILAPEPVVLSTDEDDIRRQIESRLRSEFEQDLERQMDELKKQAAAEAAAQVPPPPTRHTLGSVTDVRRLRSGIPFETEVNVEEGGIASRERESPDSYRARYRLDVTVPAPAKSLAELENTTPE